MIFLISDFIMPPNNTENIMMSDRKGDPDLNFLEISGLVSTTTKEQDVKPKESKRQPIIWTNVILITLFHVLATYMFFAYVFDIKMLTITWGRWKIFDRTIIYGDSFLEINFFFCYRVHCWWYWRFWYYRRSP